MFIVYLILAAWFVTSVPFGVLVGKLIHARTRDRNITITSPRPVRSPARSYAAYNS